MSEKVPDTADASEAKEPVLSHVGGSKSDTFNLSIVQAAANTFWVTSQDEVHKAATVATQALKGITPADELEGMLAAQMIAAHQASMECFRRSMIVEQSLEGRAMNLNQANKLSRTYATLLEALNRHRGKGGQQKVVVEHVHVSEGGQAIIGSVRTGGGAAKRNQRQSYAEDQLTHAPQPPMWSENQEREAVPVAGHEERPMPDARRNEPRCSEG
ncbi:hypothetical protein [Beijerinckia sp. L45]|uniref:hypothetical protein n=1 Tax=Beijerinckia sp. L45 TaxID=1641855 RepID=UPI00131B8FC1|nr:hypothetical protein [Beijerinckia sp. L45]